MSNRTDLAKASVAKAPNLPESLRRLLGDPFQLDSEIEKGVLPTWEAPTVPPESMKLRAAVQELERGLMPATPGHMAWCLNKLFVLPTRSATATTAAFQTDNFIDACGHFPDDLWTAGTRELLQTKTFRPVPAELVEAIGRKYRERQRMIERAKLLLASKPETKPGTGPVFVPANVRIKRIRDEWLARTDHPYRIANAANTERCLALEEKRPMERWARDHFDAQEAGQKSRGGSVGELAQAIVARTPQSQAGLLRARARYWRGQGSAEFANDLDRQADALCPQERTDVPEAEYQGAAA